MTILKHKKDRRGQREMACQIHVLELLFRLRNQIPPKGTHAQRVYGRYSSKARGQRKKKESSIPTQEAQRKKVQNKSWAVMISQVFEVDPLRCVHSDAYPEENLDQTTHIKRLISSIRLKPLG